jgi:hypothetical protein
MGIRTRIRFMRLCALLARQRADRKTALDMVLFGLLGGTVFVIGFAFVLFGQQRTYGVDDRRQVVPIEIRFREIASTFCFAN